jgi:hypothetical protein
MVTAESLAAYARHDKRTRLFYEAGKRAQALGRPLVVIGDPDAGMHTRLLRAYGCGDVCVDLNGCPLCPVVRAADITQGPVPGIEANSGVVFVSCVLEYEFGRHYAQIIHARAACVLEYVSDVAAAMHEILRMAGDPEHVFLVTVQPWTLTAALHPRARWAGISDTHIVSMGPITSLHRGFAAGVVLSLAAASVASPQPVPTPPSPPTPSPGPSGPPKPRTPT